MESLQGEKTVSTVVCTGKQKNTPSITDQAFSIASCNSRHALSSRVVDLPTSPYSTVVCTRKQKNTPSITDQAYSIASYNSRHALSSRVVDLPTSPYPTLSASSSKQIVQTDNVAKFQ